VLGTEDFDLKALAKVEGLAQMVFNENSENNNKEYLSDNGAEIVKNTKELDEFVRSLKGRHNKQERAKIH
jgi:hypothetical protein